MPSYATFNDLRAISLKFKNREEFIKQASAYSVLKNVFLSHSSKDHDYLPNVIQILEEQGGSVYIDDRDTSLPSNVTFETAEILRKAINTTKKMVVLVSFNTKDSKWIPWELGLGDGKKMEENVALFPIVGSEPKSWAEQEYLGLYRKIMKADTKTGDKDNWLVFDPRKKTFISLRHWIIGLNEWLYPLTLKS